MRSNTREHFAVHGFKQVPFAVASRWFQGECQIHSYELNELLGTKLRALYQRKQGRDLFDLATALQTTPVEPQRIVQTFLRYMEHEGHSITRAQFEENLTLKMQDPAFLADIRPLLITDVNWDPHAARLYGLPPDCTATRRSVERRSLLKQRITLPNARRRPWITLQQWWKVLRLSLRTRRQVSVRSLRGRVTWHGDIDASRVGRMTKGRD